MSQTTEFHQNIIRLVKEIPSGKVSTYGALAKMAGYPGHARQVAWFLHSSSRKYRLPWHRVINSQGKISLPGPSGDKQKRRLSKEGVSFSPSGRVNLKVFMWAADSEP